MKMEKISKQKARLIVDRVKKNFLFTGVWHDSEIASLLRYIPIICRVDDEKQYAYTDGHCIILGLKFLEADSESFQRAVLLHEMIHIMYQHPQRGKGKIIPVWQIAVDIITNAIVELYEKEAEKMGCSDTPFFNIYIDKVCGEKISAINYRDFIDQNDLYKKPIHRWNCEEVYDYLLKNKVKIVSVDSMSDCDLESISPLTNEEIESIPADLRGELSDSDEQTLEKWNDRLEKASKEYGSCKGSILGKVTEKAPPKKEDWKKRLRKFAKQKLGRKTELSYSKIGRSFSSLNRKRKHTKILVPGYVEEAAIKKICVCLDTSGSVMWDKPLLTAFCAEIDNIQKSTKADLHIIFADCEVEGEVVLKYSASNGFYDAVINRKVELAGGGGTSFIPGVKRMHDIKANVYFYLTDGYGSFPNPKEVSSSLKTKLLWVINTEVKPKDLGHLINISV